MSDGSCMSSLTHWIAWVTVRDAQGYAEWTSGPLFLQERDDVLINRRSVNRYKVISRTEGQYGG